MKAKVMGVVKNLDGDACGGSLPAFWRFKTPFSRRKSNRLGRARAREELGLRPSPRRRRQPHRFINAEQQRPGDMAGTQACPSVPPEDLNQSCEYLIRLSVQRELSFDDDGLRAKRLCCSYKRLQRILGRRRRHRDRSGITSWRRIRGSGIDCRHYAYSGVFQIRRNRAVQRHFSKGFWHRFPIRLRPLPVRLPVRVPPRSRPLGSRP